MLSSFKLSVIYCEGYQFLLVLQWVLVLYFVNVQVFLPVLLLAQRYNGLVKSLHYHWDEKMGKNVLVFSSFSTMT